MICPFCGTEFSEEESLAVCKGCPISRACGMLQCPNCHYEMPEEPKEIKTIKSWLEKRNENKRKS